jgi:DNA-binding LacI/PurR family transcriptional regulator
MKREVTLAYLARRLGVHHTTVSLALRDSDRISKDVRRRVRALAERCHYTPNINARRLVRGRADHVALVVRYLDAPFYAELSDRFVRTFSEFNLRVSLDVADWSEESTVSSVRNFGGEMVDAIFVCPTHPSMSFARIKAVARCPVIGLVHRPADSLVPYVAFDLRETAREGTRHLVRLGRQRIGYVGSANKADGRFEGYCIALREAGMTSDPSWQVCDELFALERGQEAGEKLARLDRPPDALFVASDLLAMGVIRGLGRKGIRVPGDVAVVSHDGIKLGAYCRPALTTMALPLHLMANHCLAMLQAIHSGKTKEEILGMSLALQAKLVVRESCGQKVDRSDAEEPGYTRQESKPVAQSAGRLISGGTAGSVPELQKRKP